MNKARRQTLARIKDDLDGIVADLDNERAEEQDTFDNMPEGLQASENGQRIQAAAETLMEAVDAVNEAISAIEAAVE